MLASKQRTETRGVLVFFMENLSVTSGMNSGISCAGLKHSGMVHESFAVISMRSSITVSILALMIGLRHK